MTRATAPTVVELRGTDDDGELLGGKGAALDRLISWGVRVPSTAVVTAEAYRATIARPEIASLLRGIDAGEAPTAAEVDAVFLGAGLPTAVRSDVVGVARTIAAGRPLAIRSSATVEDLGGSSFAGQYRSILDVSADDADAVERAVLQVFASLVHPAPRTYRAALGIDSHDIAMAAVMMQMIDSQRAGVVFTQDPTTPEPIVRVEVVDGLGDELVSGRRTPTVHQLPRPGTDGARPAITDDLHEIVAAAMAIEQHAGCAQDIEWAQDGTTLWIVQARPVTAAHGAVVDPFDDAPSALADSELTTEGIGEMLPGALPPLIWQTAATVVEDGFRSLLDVLGADVSIASGPTWLLRRTGGHAVLDVSRLELLMAAIPGARARVQARYFGAETTTETVAPSQHASRLAVARHRRRAARARRAAAFDAEVMEHAARALERALDDDTATTRPDLDAVTLLARRRELLAIAARAMAAELTVSADAGAIRDAVEGLLTRWIDRDTAAHWADRITVPERRLPVSPAASAAVFAGPTWSERGLDPTLHHTGATRDDSLEELAVVLESAPRWPAPGLRRRLTRRRLEHLAGRAAQQLTRRECTKTAILVFGGEVRRVHLALGRLLVEQGALDSACDVDLLTISEIEDRLLHGVGPSSREVDRRRRAHRHNLASPPPPARWRGAPPATPTVRTGALVGWPVSGGRFIGRARRVDDPSDPIEGDEVLVAVATDPSWSPLLVRCGALVLERGGPLSHAAILAREFGVPAVFNLPDAATSLAGHRVLVDGDAGTVTILDDEATP